MKFSSTVFTKGEMNDMTDDAFLSFVKQGDIQVELEEGESLEDDSTVEIEPVDRFIPMDIESIMDCIYDTEGFKKGIDSVSFECGQLTALINTGLTPKDALEFLAMKVTYAHENDIAEVTSKMNIEISKVQAIKVESGGL